MRRRTQLNRADLLECLHAYGEAYFEGMAAALGYVYQQPSKEIRVEVPGLPLGIALGLPTIVTGPAVTPKARFWRVVENRLLKPEEVVRNEPAWFRNAEPFQGEDELRAPADVSPPPQPPLLPWSRLWPFLKMVLGARQATRTLDLPRIITRLARAQTLRYLPRQQRHGWATECQLIVDYAESLLPFWNDFNQLHRRLRQLRGARGLRLLAFPDGDPGGRCWWHDGREWRESDSGPVPGPGTAVLVLGDLGGNDPTDVRRRQWRHLGARLRRAGCQPVALMPCPPRWWDGELTRLFYPACWDRTARLPRRFGARRMASSSAGRAGSDTGAERLLALLAPAIRIEPALLRAVRYLLPAREADVGSEVAAWNHSRVHPTPLAFYYDHEAIAGYRRAFQDQDATLRRQVAGLVVSHHRHLSPSIGHEERWLIADLENACDVPAQRFLARIVRTLRDRRNVAIADFAQAWVGRMAPRQHEAMWQDEALAAAWALVNWTVLRAGKVTPPPGLDLGRISWVLGQDQTLKRYTLRQRGPALYLEMDVPATAATELDAPGSPVAELGAIASCVQLQRSETDTPSLQPLDRPILLPASGRLRLKTDYQELIFDSIERPEWADAIGRDEQGLFVAWQGRQRRARWVNPGPYPVYNLSGKQFGELDITAGCWGDESEARAQPYQGFRQPDWAIKPLPSILKDFMPDTETARRIIQIALIAGRRRLNAYEASQVLSAYEIPVVPLYFASTYEAASEIALELRVPVVLKILSPDITNKSEVGGVAFGLNNPLQVLVSASGMLARVRELAPAAVIDGFAVQPMQSRHDAYELMIGVRTDRRFGPVIFFGHGGTEAEVIDDVAYALPPLNMQLACDLMSRTRLYRQIVGNRGRPVDLDEIALTLIKVSQIVVDLAEVVEMDINPLWINNNGLLALDANILIEPATIPGA
ncbi:MAG TPA: acetate--CoA ligase family protein [Candidatus Competibacter phosphatis]|nr:acetate--CoA ligase family protein [Candidatus Competibacter phosphatis]